MRTLKETVAAIRAKSIRNRVTGCLEYQGERNKKGYGRIFFAGRYPVIHRVIFEYFNGPIPKGIQILHRCDTTNCGEETHLFAGTNSTNQLDRVSKSRFTKLHTEDVMRIKDMLAAGESQTAIGRWFDVGQPMVSRVANGLRFAQVGV